MEFLKDYQYTLHYHPDKANIVADALSRKSRGVLSCLITSRWKMLFDLEDIELTSGEHQKVFVRGLATRPRLIARVIEL